MNKAIDDKLIEMLNVLPIASRLRTCLNLRLSDFAAQRLGYRSVCHVKGSDRLAVEDIFKNLINTLIYVTYECVSKINQEHTYQSFIYDLCDFDLEVMLEDTLYNIVTHEDIALFERQFFI